MTRKKANSDNGASTRTKTRAYVGIFYPESVPDWAERITQTHIPAIVAIHDKDVNPDGTPKKTHGHMMIVFDGPRTMKQAKDVLTAAGCIEHIEAVNSIVGQARYLRHLDNPEKHSYGADAIRCFSGLDYEELCNRSQDRVKALKEMEEFIDGHVVYMYNKFSKYCRENNMVWYRHLTTDCGYHIKEYLKSKYFEEYGADRRIMSDIFAREEIEIRTGEIVGPNCGADKKLEEIESEE